MGRIRLWLYSIDERVKELLHLIFVRYIFAFLTVVALVLILSLILLSRFQTKYWAGTPGILFAIFIGVLTVIGLILTWRSIRESYFISRITTFRSLLIRIGDLLCEAQREGKGINVLCFTPAIGNLSCPAEFAQLKQRIKGIGREGFFIEIVCLNDPILNNTVSPDFKTFREKLEGFVKEQKKGKKKEIENEIGEILRDKKENFKKESCLFAFYYSYGEILERYYGLDRKKKEFQKTFLEGYKEALNLIETLKEKGAKFYPKREDNLPDFHLFFTSDRGIVYFPLSYYPYFFKRSLSIKEKEDMMKDIVNRRTPVEILGFETTEKDLILRFEELFDFCKKYTK